MEKAASHKGGEIFSIGHGTKPIARLVAELKSYEIAYLVDIRSFPYSTFHPQHNQDVFRRAMEQAGITYGYLGDLLGGFPEDRTCYSDGQVDYWILRDKEYFRRGMERIRTAWQQGYRICLMCSENDPSICHRTRLIGVELQKEGIEMHHIVAQGQAKSQSQLIAELTGGTGLQDLFGEIELPSRNKY